MIYALAGLALVNARGGGSFIFIRTEQVFSDNVLGYTWRDVVADMVANPRWPEMLVISFYSQMNPPYWSIGVEFVFYALCPLLVVAARREFACLHIALIASLLFSLLIALNTFRADLNHNTTVYQNPFFSFSMFCLGSWFLFLYRKLAAEGRLVTVSPVAALIATGVLIVYFYSEIDRWVTLGIEDLPRRRYVYFYATLPAVALLGMLVVITREFSARTVWIGRICGDISYGVYLSHFVAGFLLLWLTEVLSESRLQPVIQPNTIQFGLAVAMLSLLFAAATYFLVETSIERYIRIRVRPVALTRVSQGSVLT
jgi:peptidoglycan/LPS O-acetylase OafA/YrhL